METKLPTPLADYAGDIKPYRLNNMLKTAGRVMDVIIKGDVGVTYKECLIVLDIVRSSIVQAENAKEDV